MKISHKKGHGALSDVYPAQDCPYSELVHEKPSGHQDARGFVTTRHLDGEADPQMGGCA